MNKGHWILGLASLSSATYLLNRWTRMRGATALEAAGPLPGDNIIAAPMLQTTHAITIDAPPTQVWPWLLQMGYYRAGWYTDNDYWWDRLADRYLRRLVRREAEHSEQGFRQQRSEERLVAEWQRLAPGDVILDGPPGTAYFTVVALEPNRILTLYSDTHLRFLFPLWLRDHPRAAIGGDFSWAFVLQPTEGGRTRLLIRARARIRPTWYRAIATLTFPIVDAALVMKMLQAIKRRAESHAYFRR